MKNPYSHLKEYEGSVLTYRELCDLLGVEFKRGKGKDLQLKQIGQYIELDRNVVPRKIVLKQIYGDDNIKSATQRGKYFPYFKNLLLSGLKQENPISRTYSELIVEFGFARKEYSKARYEEMNFPVSIKEKFSKDIDIDFLTEQNLYSFLNMTGVLLKEMIRSSIRQMEKKELITVVRSLRLYREAFGVAGKKYIEHYDLTPKEHEEYSNIGKKIIEKYNLSGLQALFFRGGKSKKIVAAQEEYHEKLDQFITNLGYEKSATLLILSLTPAGRAEEINRAYLDRSKIREFTHKKISEEKEIKKVIPEPLLEMFIQYFFRSPNSHNI